MNAINFFEEGIKFVLSNPSQIRDWLIDIAQSEGFEIEEINYVFCSDEYLLQINQQYLNHDYYTDIITFDNSESFQVITSDIFISIERVAENASALQVSPDKELHRVIIHGLLHLLGYGDKTDNEIRSMRQKEDACLSLLN